MKKLKIIAIVLVILSIIGAGSYYIVRNYSSGARMGVITKLSNKGILIKSWEGELNMGGVMNGSTDTATINTASNIFEFNVDPDSVQEVKTAMQSGKRVELEYRQWMFTPFWIDHPHVVYNVKYLNQSP